MKSQLLRKLRQRDHMRSQEISAATAWTRAPSPNNNKVGMEVEFGKMRKF